MTMLAQRKTHENSRMGFDTNRFPGAATSGTGRLLLKQTDEPMKAPHICSRGLLQSLAMQNPLTSNLYSV